MTALHSPQAYLANAEASEKRYEWAKAALDYGEAVKRAVESRDLLNAARLQERVGYCLFRAAFQVETHDRFVAGMRSAIEAYKTAEAAYAKLEEKLPWVYRCSAATTYLRHWVAATPTEKGELMKEWLSEQEQALESFWSRGDKLEFARTYAQPQHAFECFYDWTHNAEALETGLGRGIKWGETVVEALSGLNAKAEEAACYRVLDICIGRRLHALGEVPDEYARGRTQLKDGNDRELLLAQELNDAYLTAYASTESWWNSPASPEQRREWQMKALQAAQETRDLHATLHVSLTFVIGTLGRAATTDDPDEAIEQLDKARQWLEKMKPMCSTISWYGNRTGAETAWPPWGCIDYYVQRSGRETDLQKKRDLLDKALHIASQNLQRAKDYWGDLSHTQITSQYGFALSTRAKLEHDPAMRRSMLQDAFTLMSDSLGVLPTSRLRHLQYCAGLADIKAGLAALGKEPHEQAELLREAVTFKEEVLEYLRLWKVRAPGGPEGYFAVSAAHYPAHARFLVRLQSLDKERTHLERAVEVLKEGIDVAQETGLVSRTAECYWQLGMTHDALGDFTQAGTSFKEACQAYSEASEKIPQLKGFYTDYAAYMSAWSAIEQARSSHNQRRHDEAAVYFDRAAQLLDNTARWKELSLSYSAWMLLEKAEGLSRRENTVEARDTFKQAADLFTGAKQKIIVRLAKAQLGEEQQNAEELAEASDSRREYCLARATLEDARVSAGQGDYSSSSEKYGVAAGKLEELLNRVERDADRRELKPIASLCRAWEKMMRAEDRASPSLYGEAADVFEEVVKEALDSQTSLLARANSYMCKALESGTRFEASKDPELFSAAKKHLEAATNQYLRAGFRNTSEYSRATSKLLDAYYYMYQAQVETDPVKRAQLYEMAETLLQASAGSYVKARLPAKAEDVRRVLEITREDKEVALSLSQILGVPTTASATRAFTAPAQTREQAVGLERFENADIQANLMPHNQEARLGDTVKLKIDLVNAGRGGAQLIKVAELLPESFELIEKPDTYLVEDHGLNLKGRSLAPLRTEELGLILKPLDKGTYQIKPRILYLDEAGKYKYHEPEPATIIVKELGISGWLKGPTRDKTHLV